MKIQLHPLVQELLDRALGVSYRTRREKSWQFGLVGISLLLITASGYTTYQGLSKLLPGPVAFIAMLGIQGVVFFASWRIAVVRHHYQLNFNLAFIYIVAALISMFFSWVSILDILYPTNLRMQDEVDHAVAEGNTMVYETTLHLRKQTEADTRAVGIRLRQWNDSVHHVLSPLFQEIAAPFAEAEARLARYDSLLAKEARNAGARGVDSNYWKYQGWRDNYQIRTYAPLKAKIDRLGEMQQEVETAFGYLLASPDHLTASNFTRYREAMETFRQGLAAYSGRAPLRLDAPAAIFEGIATVSPVNDFILRQRQRFDIQGDTSILAVRDSMRAFIASLRDLGTVADLDVAALQHQVTRVGKFGGDNAHTIAVAVGGLSRGEVLTIFALIIAIGLDILILLCALLSYQEGSFLEMKKPEDLLELQELALEVTFAMDHEHEWQKEPVFVRRIAQMVMACKPEAESAVKGLPLYLYWEDIDKLNLGAVAAVLIARQYAYRTKTGDKLFLRTSLVLWMHEQLLNAAGKKESMATFEKVTAPLGTESAQAIKDALHNHSKIESYA